MTFAGSRVLALSAALALPACQAGAGSQSGSLDVVAVAIAGALQGTAADAPDHEKALRLSAWLHANVEPEPATAHPDPVTVILEGKGDPFAKTGLLVAMLRRLDIPYSVHVASGVASYAWYPIVEINDRDGDHGIDAFSGRYGADYDGSPLPVTLMFDQPSAGYSSVLAPAWDTLRAAKKMKLANTAYYDIAVVRDYRFSREITATAQVWGGALYAAALTGVGSWSSRLGTFMLAHRYQFPEMASAATFQLEARFAAGPPGGLLVIGTGARILRKENLAGGIRYDFEATGAAPSVVLGAQEGEYAAFDTVRWSIR